MAFRLFKWAHITLSARVTCFQFSLLLFPEAATNQHSTSKNTCAELRSEEYSSAKQHLIYVRMYGYFIEQLGTLLVQWLPHVNMATSSDTEQCPPCPLLERLISCVFVAHCVFGFILICCSCGYALIKAVPMCGIITDKLMPVHVAAYRVSQFKITLILFMVGPPDES